MEQYLRVNGMGYTTSYIRRYDDGGEHTHFELVQGKQDVTSYTSQLMYLINIYEGNLNKRGSSNSAYCWTYWKGLRGKPRRVVFNDALLYFKSVCGLELKTDSKRIMWTCIKADWTKEFSLNGLLEKRFLQCKARATNDWASSDHLAYLVNIYPDPNIASWIAEHGGHIDSEKIALSEMIQWIWRSAIRNGKPINLYIPSKRMRTLLQDWLSSSEKPLSSESEAC